MNSSVLSTKKLEHGTWYLDSGAAHSVTWDKSVFIHYKPTDENQNRCIQTASGDKIRVSGQGLVVLKTFVNNEECSLILKNVLHVPDANFQLISLSSLASSGCEVDLNNNYGIVRTNSGKIIIQAKLDNNEHLWKLSTDIVNNSKKILEKYKPEIIALCEMSKARAGINLNRRNNKDMAFDMNILLAEYMKQGDFKGLSKLYNTVCGQAKGKDKTWLIDIDTKDELDLRQISNDIAMLEPFGDKVIETIPSKSGFHLITRSFNSKDFSKIYPDVEIHRNNPTNLYIS